MKFYIAGFFGSLALRATIEFLVGDYRLLRWVWDAEER